MAEMGDRLPTEDEKAIGAWSAEQAGLVDPRSRDEMAKLRAIREHQLASDNWDQGQTERAVRRAIASMYPTMTPDYAYELAKGIDRIERLLTKIVNSPVIPFTPPNPIPTGPQTWPANPKPNWTAPMGETWRAE